VITRYLYKPDAGEGMTRFNDNQRLHIFIVDSATKQVQQLTQGEFDEHSVDWSPDGKKIFHNDEPTYQELAGSIPSKSRFPCTVCIPELRCHHEQYLSILL